MTTGPRLLLASALGLAAGWGTPGRADDPARKADPMTAADLAAAQGEWVIDRLEVPDNFPRKPPEGFVRDLSGVVKGDRLTINSPRVKGHEPKSEPALLVVDGAKNPKELDVVAIDADGSPLRQPGAKEAERTRCIYKFDGDKIVIAAPSHSEAPRPTEFKPAPPKDPKGYPAADRSAVIVVHLKKKPK